MPIFATRNPVYKASKSVKEEWSIFRKGLNLLLRPTEVSTQELAVAENIMLVGSGVPTGRYGTSLFFNAGDSGNVKGMGSYKSDDGAQNEFLSVTDDGYLVKKNGLSYSLITGQSWPTVSEVAMEQLGGSTYIVSPDREFVEYTGSSLVVYSPIAEPTGLQVTNFSGMTGPNTSSYQVVAIGANGGQTKPSTNYVLTNIPSDLTLSQYKLFWTAPSHATMRGYEIYRGSQGNETLLATVGPESTSYVDSGETSAISILAPLTNSTGGVKSRFLKKYKDRLLAVDADDPNKLLISGRYPYHTKFSWLDGGGYIYIESGSGDVITGVEVQPIADKIVVYKSKGSYLVGIDTVSIGNYAVLDPSYQAISTAVGCSSPRTIATVENDTFYFGRDGVYVTGYEPNFLNIIRTNEISARIRPYLQELSEEDFETACALYADKKYILSFPKRKEAMVYDRERGAWIGPWRFPFGISSMIKYIDSSGSEKWVLGLDGQPDIMAFDIGGNQDDNTLIAKSLRTKKTAFGDWTSLYIIQFFYVLLRNIVGTATVNILGEDRNGIVSTIKTFTVSGASTGGFTGWGVDLWGLTKWGDSNGTKVTVSADETTRWGPLFKEIRLVQIEVVTNSANSNFELLEIKLKAGKMGSATLSSSQRA